MIKPAVDFILQEVGPAGEEPPEECDTEGGTVFFEAAPSFPQAGIGFLFLKESAF